MGFHIREVSILLSLPVETIRNVDIIGKILTRVHADGKMHGYVKYTIQ